MAKRRNSMAKKAEKFYECKHRRSCKSYDCVGRRKHTAAEHYDCENQDGEIIPCYRPSYCHEISKSTHCVPWKKRNHHGLSLWEY